jgi:hypothetical protein
MKAMTIVAATAAVSRMAEGQGLDVKHLQPNKTAAIANGAWAAGDTLY